jgi:hypothetical protein
MGRSLVRLASVLLAILAVMLPTLASPTSAGELGGFGPPSQAPGTCSFYQVPSTGHFFVFFFTNAAGKSPNSLPQIGPDAKPPKFQTIQPNVIALGPIETLPPGLAARCNSAT